MTAAPLSFFWQFLTGDCPATSRSLILEQVTNGLAVRMAVLFLVNGGEGPQEAVVENSGCQIGGGLGYDAPEL